MIYIYYFLQHNNVMSCPDLIFNCNSREQNSRHLPFGYCIVYLYLLLEYKGQLVDLHKL